MTPAQFNFLAQMIVSFFADRPKESVSSWCERELQFNEPDNRGPFTISGREYIREPLDAWADPMISDQVMVFGSQSGKTGIIMGGGAWTIVNDPARLFWVMPTRDVVRKFSRTRWIPMLKASRSVAQLIPTGARRHDFATLEQQMGNAIIDLIWSNSPAALSSVPARIAILDEVDKFAEGGNREADAVSLANQRTKNFASPKRIKTSTPTLSEGLIWREFQKTDQRRRWMPCPLCKKSVVLAWSKQFTVFRLTGGEAFVKWDKEARRADGTWDLDRAEKSARAECPHCGGHILDGHKTLMDRSGEWRPSAVAARGYRGWHLPSLYAIGPETSFGKLAVKFLQAQNSLEGLQGFINGDLAEPWENQEARSERIEVVAAPDAPPISGAVPILTVDHQLTSPHFWYVARAWNKDSRLLDFGHLDRWEEVRAKQLEHKVADNHVSIDSGHAAEEVYEACLRWGQLVSRPHGPPFFVGWTPSKGFDRQEPWLDPKTKQARPFALGAAALPDKRFRLPLLEFMADHIKDILDRLRRGRAAFKWELSDKADDEYFRHLDAEYKKPFYNARTHRVKYVWARRSNQWPNHLLDCEVMQIVMALFHKLLPMGIESEAKSIQENKA